MQIPANFKYRGRQRSFSCHLVLSWIRPLGMRLIRPYDFRAGIRGYRLGWSLAGPPMMTVFCFVFGRTMVDTGLSHMGPEALELARNHRVARIFLTHHHEDHSGNAARIQDGLGAKVFGHDLTRAKMKSRYPILPYQKLVWGRTTPMAVSALPPTIETLLGHLVAIHTPGHSRDHLSYHLPDQGILFSGDLYLGDRIKFFRSDEDVMAEVDSLKKVAALDFDTLLCSHNPRVEKGRSHILAKLDFLENFCGGIAALHGKGYPEKEIFRELGLKEARFTKWFCVGNVSMMNGVRSVVRRLELQENRAG